MITLSNAKDLIKIARDAITEQSLKIPKNKDLLKKTAVFVTLETHPDKELRGCIGYSEPQFPLYEAVYNAAKLAAFGDPRFPPLTKEEASKVTVEISILTKFKLIRVSKPTEYLKVIKPHKDGLILRSGPYIGIFLPQVWEQISKTENFLDNLCLKAGLPPGSWASKGVELSRFSVGAFREVKPFGHVIKSK